MRYFVIIFLIIILAVQGVLLMLFTETGNDMLLPQVNTYLKEDTKKHKIVVSQFRLHLDTLSFVAKVDDTIDLKAQGKIGLFSQTFDMDYILEADEIKTGTISIKEKINVKGNVKGHKEDMKIRGKGIAFKSYIDFDLRRVKKELQDIKINMKKAEISKILAVFHKDTYAEGLLTLEVDMPQYNPQNPQGKANIFIQQMTLDADKISKDFDIKLAENTLVSADLQATVKDKIVLVHGTLKSNIANIKIKNGTYDPLSKEFDLGYDIVVSDLAKFNTLAKRELHGPFSLSGKVGKKYKRFVISGVTGSFGGKSSFMYENDNLHVYFDDIKTETLLYKLGEKNYISGIMTSNIQFNDVQKGTGAFDAAINGRVNTKVFKEKTKTDLGETFNVDAHFQGRIQEKKIFSNIVLDTTMAKIKAEKFMYDLKQRSWSSDYSLDIRDMQKLKPLTRGALNGDMYLSGEIKKDKDLVVTGQGKEFDGSIDFKLLNDDLKADIKGATVSKVMTMMGYPQVIEAVTEAKADYNVKQRKGTVHGTLDNARILPSQLTFILEKYAGMKLTHERFNKSKFAANINKEIIHFSMDARNKRNYIKVSKGLLDKRTELLRADIDVMMEGKDMTATVQGTVGNPRVALNSSEYLKKKLNKKMDKLIDKNIKGESGKQLKSILKGFF